MLNDFEYKALLVKEQIEKDFKELDEEQLAVAFDKFKEDKRTLSFINYYNRTVLDKEKIRFGEFKKEWALQGMTREFFSYFDEHFDELRVEIEQEKDIRSFYEKYCCTFRNEGSFCSKLFHTVLPNEFPPVDNPIKKKFELHKEEFIKSVLIIKKGYEMFIKDNPVLINRIRKVLTQDKFSYLRINELSDMRILDMYYWFKENRE